MENKNKYLIFGVLALALIIVIGFLVNGGAQETAVDGTTGQGAIQPKVVALNSEYSSLMQSKCLTCHAVRDGEADRIGGVRKTPEGWEDTISRMQRLWGVQLTREESVELVKELSYTNGLAPEEMENVMYWLTETGTTFEPMVGNESVQQSCIRCHSGGRALAQYRTEDEWAKIKDFHIGMNPSIVYQVRDVNWAEVSEQAIAYLAELNKYDSAEWRKWQEADLSYDLSGTWRIIGYQPGVGKYSGTAEIEQKDGDFYEKRTLLLTNGEEVVYEGNVRLYSGYSLRSSLEGNNERLRGVYNVKNNGETIEGRWNKVGDKGIYSDEIYYKVGEPTLLTVWPQALRQADQATFRIMAANLPVGLEKGDIQVSQGVEVVEVVKQEHGDVWVTLKAGAGAGQGEVELKINGVAEGVRIALFEEIEEIKVLPEFALARIGDGDEGVKQSVQFEAIAYATNTHGQELEIGPVEVTWGLEEYFSFDIEDDDNKYIGTIDAKTGIFTPGAAGPNPERYWTANNVGNATVVAVYTDPVTGQEVRGSTFLIVSVPKYVNVN